MSEGAGQPPGASAADPAGDGFNLEDPLGAGGAASSYEGEYSETVKRLLKNIKRDRGELTTVSGRAGSEDEGADAQEAAGENGGHSRAVTENGKNEAESAERTSNLSNSSNAHGASFAAEPGAVESKDDAGAPANASGSGAGVGRTTAQGPSPGAAAPSRAAPPAQPHPDAILAAAAAAAAAAEEEEAVAEAARGDLAAATKTPPSSPNKAAAPKFVGEFAHAAPTKSAPPAHPHPFNPTHSPVKHVQSSASVYIHTYIHTYIH
jgi:hypothetical protein